MSIDFAKCWIISRTNADAFVKGGIAAEKKVNKEEIND